MEVKVLNNSGKETAKQVALSDTIFNIEPNDHAIYLDIKQYLANQRQGTHKTKDRSEISGSTRKLKKQKGTGGARAGDINSGTRVGGGRFFGPKPRNYGFKLNIKLKRLARKSALSYKNKAQDLIVMEDFNFESPKTKLFLGFLDNIKLNNEKLLLILGSQNENVYLSSKNLKKVKVVTADTLNTYDILNAKKVILAESSIQVIEQILN